MFNEIIIVAILFAIGASLLALELLIIPGFGLTGILGIAAFGGALFLSFYFFGVMWGSIILVVAAIIVIASIIFIIKSKPTRKMVLDNNLTSSHIDDQSKIDMTKLVGKEGVAVTLLRPSGAVEINGVRYDALTDGEYIQSGNKIKIIDFKDGHLIVERITN